MSGTQTLRALLKEIEWSGPSGYQEDAPQSCPVCKRERFEGHAPDCRLAAALRELA